MKMTLTFQSKDAYNQKTDENPIGSQILIFLTMIPKNELDHYLRQISLLKQQIAEMQEKLQELESRLQVTVSNLVDRNQELESLACLYSDSGTAICNWTENNL